MHKRIAFFALFLIPGCAHHKPRPGIKPLHPLAACHPISTQEKGVIVRARWFDRTQSCEQFGVAPKGLADKSANALYPLQLSITNKSEKTWIYYPTLIDLPLACQEEALNLIQKDIYPKQQQKEIMHELDIAHIKNACKRTEKRLCAMLLDEQITLWPQETIEGCVFAYATKKNKPFGTNFTITLVNADDPADQLAITVNPRN